MDTVGVGIVGAGFVADVHARAYRELRGLGVRLAAIHSRTRSKAEELAQRYGIAQVMPDIESLLALDSVDIVDLCVPNDMHHEFTLLAARAGKHVICEKPLTGYFAGGDEATRTPRAQMLTAALRSADRMIAVAEDSGVKLMYAENWLYSPVVVKARNLIKASKGTILEIRGEESHHGSHAAYARKWRYTGGGALIRLGAHPLGAILHLKHSEGVWRDGRPITPRFVMAQVANLNEVDSVKDQPTNWMVKDWVDVENWAKVIITFSDGSKGIVSASDACLGGMEDTLDIFLSNARVHCNFARSNMLEAYAPDPAIFEPEYIAEKVETKAGWSFPSVGEEWLLGYQAELKDFVEAVKFDRSPVSDAYLGREVVRVIYAAYLSAEEGRVVSLD